MNKVGRPKSDDPLVKGLHIKFTANEYNLIKEKAEKEKRPVANLIRQLVLENLKK